MTNQGPATLERVLVVTLGHVDHGKTTLVRALTGVDTDRLPDEKRRGISIELGYATLPDAPLTFIDVPGHRKLVHTMIAGLGGVDVGLLVVAADDGAMPQTREHLQIFRLAGLRHLVIALSKADLVDPETLELATLDVEASLEALGFGDCPIIPTDTFTGRGIREVREALLAVIPRRSSTPSASLWLAIDRVFSVKGSGTVVTGTLTRGAVMREQELRLLTATDSLRVRCRRLEVHGQSVESVGAPSRVALNLALPRGQAIERGDALVDLVHGGLSKRLDLALTALEEAGGELSDGASVLCHVGTTHRQGRLTWFEAPRPVGDGLLRGFAHLALEAPFPVQPGIPLILRGFRAATGRGATLAGGRVLDIDAAALPRRKSCVRGSDLRQWENRLLGLRALDAERLDEACEHWLLAITPRVAHSKELEARLGIPARRLERALKNNQRLKILGDSVTTRHALTYLQGLLLARVSGYHELTPHELGMPREAALAELGRLANKPIAERVIQASLEAGQLLETQSRLATPEFAKSGGASVQRVCEQALEVLLRRGLRASSERELVTELRLEADAARVALAELASRREARCLSNLWFAEARLKELQALVVAHFEQRPSLSLADLKLIARVSRKQAVPLMEYLDRARVTRRAGDARVPYGT
ncbi:MAG: selenocysteine-specific translation elongation factor [Polyangiaceae bacterium]